jgi:hypothetical protein
MVMMMTRRILLVVHHRGNNHDDIGYYFDWCNCIRIHSFDCTTLIV